MRRVAISAWLGLAMAALFFYPLAAALDGDVYYLQWQARDTAEAGVALALLALAAGCVIYTVWPRTTRLATGTLVAVAVVPLASFAAGLSRQLPFDDALRAAGENRMLLVAVTAAAAGASLLILLVWPLLFGRWFRRLLVLVSPVSLVVVAGFTLAAFRPDVVVALERETPAAAEAVRSACAPVLTLLFDELSFSYLYDGAQKISAELPEFGRFGSTATHYLSVSAPGSETLNALPSLLAARHVRSIEVDEDHLMEFVADGELIRFRATAPDGLFPTARALGFRTEVAGYYLAYCDLLGDVVDACRSLSFYNVSAGHGGFSPAHPALTTLVLWPRQFPFGLLKNPPFARHQRTMVDTLAAFARRPMGGDAPIFRLVHFSVPHFPFVFGEGGYDPPFNPLRTTSDEGYVRQLRYVDRLVGEVTDQLRRDGTFDRTTIVVLADHGYRFGGRERDPLHVPFLVKGAGQQSRMDVTSPVRGEALLKDVLQNACAL